MNVNYVRLTCINIVKRYYFSKLKINQLLIENVVRLVLKMAWMNTIFSVVMDTAYTNTTIFIVTTESAFKLRV